MNEDLANHLLEVHYPKGWKTPKLVTYNGLGDPRGHTHAFTMGMEDMATKKDIWCRMICYTLVYDVVAWYQTLAPCSINTYDELERAFKVAFSHKVRERHEDRDLLNIFQGERETRETS